MNDKNVNLSIKRYDLPLLPVARCKQSKNSSIAKQLLRGNFYDKQRILLSEIGPGTGIFSGSAFSYNFSKFKM